MSEFVDFTSLAFMHEWATEQNKPTRSIPTPFPGLNAICGGAGGGQGLGDDWFITIGGGTGQGKSLLAQNIAHHAMAHGYDVGFLSLEMSHISMATRFYAMATQTPVKSLERGRFDMDAFDRAWLSMSDGSLRGRFWGNSGLLSGVGAVLDASHRLKDTGCRLLVLDYLQLVTVGDDENIYRQVTTVAGAMREFAHEHKVVVLALSQYNTPTGRDTSQQPTVYGLMGGGTIANNGDMVLLLDHSRYEREEGNRAIARTFVLVPKNRYGDTGEIPIEWNYRTLTCREAMQDEERLWPR